MKIIYKSRGSGKTTDLIKLSAENGGYIVCHTKKEATRISRTAEKMNLSIPFPMTYMEFIENRYYAPNVKTVYIDNVDLFFESISKVEIGAITLTKEAPEMNKMNVREIIKNFLEENGYDGLYCYYCACKIDDLMPCEEEGIPDCKPGYVQKCPCEKYAGEEYKDYAFGIECPEGLDYCIGKEKP